MKAIAYCRVSTKDQDDRGYSLPTQLQDIQAYAARQNLEIVEVIQEDESGFLLDRPGLTKARQMLKSGQAQAIIAHDSDRLSREPIHSIMLRDEWEALGVALHYALRGQINLGDYGSDILEDIQVRTHKHEIKKLVERSRRGKRGKVKTGKVITAQRPPYGYRQKDDQLIIHEREAETVRLIFELYTTRSLSIRAIARHLSDEKIPTPADKNSHMHKKSGYGQWARNTVRAILKRETYTGTWYWGKTERKRVKGKNGPYIKIVQAPRENWIPVEVPAIITSETFEAARKQMAKNLSGAPQRKRYQYLMMSRLTCGVCGYNIYSTRTKDYRYNYSKRYHHCGSQLKRNDEVEHCGMPWFGAREVEAVVWHWVKGILEEPDIMIELIEQNLEERCNSAGDLTDALDEIRRQVEQKKNGLRRLAAFLSSEEIGDDARDAFTQQIAETEHDLGELRAKEAELAEQADDLPGRDALIKLSEAISQYQGMLLRDDEPFEVKMAWIEALDVRGTLFVEDDMRKIEVTCCLDEFAKVLWIRTPPPRKFSRILQVSQVLKINSIHRW